MTAVLTTAPAIILHDGVIHFPRTLYDYIGNSVDLGLESLFTTAGFVIPTEMASLSMIDEITMGATIHSEHMRQNWTAILITNSEMVHLWQSYWVQDESRNHIMRTPIPVGETFVFSQDAGLGDTVRAMMDVYSNDVEMALAAVSRMKPYFTKNYYHIPLKKFDAEDVRKISRVFSRPEDCAMNKFLDKVISQS